MIKANDTVEVLEGMWTEMVGMIKSVKGDVAEVIIPVEGKIKTVTLKLSQIKKIKLKVELK